MGGKGGYQFWIERDTDKVLRGLRSLEVQKVWGYYTSIAMTELLFCIIRDDIIDFTALVNGVNDYSTGTFKKVYPLYKFHSPHNGRYILTVYTLNPVNDILKGIAVRK